MVTPKQATTQARWAAWGISGLVRLLTGTLRVDASELHPHLQSLGSKPMILAIWHNRLALCLPLYQRLVARPYPSHRMAALVSASRDGALLAEVLKRFQVQPVRGSSSRRGGQALVELVHWAQEGWDLAITPDGPRGPRYQMHDGVLAAAQMSGHPILPVSYQLTRKVTTRSWDQMQIPFPFSRCIVRAAPLLTVPRRLEPEEKQALKQELQVRLDSITVD